MPADLSVGGCCCGGAIVIACPDSQFVCAVPLRLRFKKYASPLGPERFTDAIYLTVTPTDWCFNGASYTDHGPGWYTIPSILQTADERAPSGNADSYWLWFLKHNFVVVPGQYCGGDVGLVDGLCTGAPSVCNCGLAMFVGGAKFLSCSPLRIRADIGEGVDGEFFA